MEIRVLKYFLETARQENITRAAEELHITQPALSRQLHELEEELGTSLFNRGKKRTTLTDSGRRLRRRAEEIIALSDKTKAEFLAPTASLSGDIYIGAAETEGVRTLFRAFRRMLSASPDLRLHVYSGNAEKVSDLLDKGILDFGLLCNPPHLRRYAYIKLNHKDTWGILMKKDSPLAAHAFISREDLLHAPLIISKQSLDNGEFNHWFRRDMKELSIIGTYNLLFNASLMAEEGLGYVLCIDEIIHLSEDGPLIFRPLKPAVTTSDYFIWKRNQLLSPAADALRLALEKEQEQGKKGEDK